jgi:hypothetical protein
MGSYVMSEHDAHRALTDTARMRGLPERDPLEDTQRMPVADRRLRAGEARGLLVDGLVADTVQAQIT